MTKKHEFPDIGHRSKCEDFRDAIHTIGKKLLEIPLIKNHTQREETVRAYMYAVPVEAKVGLPADYRGIGSPYNVKFKCLCAELACLVNAYHRFASDPEQQVINEEDVIDFIDYLDQVLLDPDTVRTIDLGNTRWRLTNDRISNGNQLVED